MSTKSPISLLNFFVFNTSVCETEDETKKILYYYPENVDLNSQIRNVGLCQAVIKFTETFSSSPCESLHTQRTRQIFLEPEKNFWMVMTLGVPVQSKTKDGQVYIESYDDEIQDHVYQSILMNSYRLFSLIKGTFQSFIDTVGVDVLKQTTHQFYSLYLPTLKINDADLLDVFNGIHFLPLERYAYLKIQSFLNSIEEKFSKIKHLVFLYSNQLVWSGLSQEDMQVLYHHLAINVIPSYIESELKGGLYSPTRSSPMGSGAHFGRFMTGPKNESDIAGLQSIPKLYLNNGKIGCYLIIYRSLNATLCILIDEEEALDFSFFKQFDLEVGAQLTSLASEIGDNYSKSTFSNAPESQLKYLYMYFNHLNLAQKTTVHSGNMRLGHALLSQDVMKLLADLNSDLTKLGKSNEIIGKTVSDCWIVGRQSDQREFYFVWQQKNANIVDVSEEMKRLNIAYFQNIFTLD